MSGNSRAPTIIAVGSPHRRRLSIPIRLLAVFATITAGLVGTASLASAWHANVSASADCQGVISYASTAWDSASANPQIEIAYSDHGTAGPWTRVTVGAFDKSDNFSFNGTFTPTSDAPGTTLTVRAMALVPWTGQPTLEANPQYADVLIPTRCAQPLTVLLPCPSSVVYGQVATFTAAAQGGEGPYHYQWTLGGKPAGTDSASYQVTLTSSKDVVAVTVTDAKQRTATTTAATCVGSYPTPTVTMACPAAFTYGHPATWTATATAAIAGDALHYLWTLNGKVAGGDTDKLTTTLNSARDQLTVTVKESFLDGRSANSSPASASCEGSHPKPTVIMACPAAFTYGQPATWTATATAGVASDALHYNWTLNGKAVGGNSDRLTTTLNSANDKLTVTVTEVSADGTSSTSSPASATCVGTPPKPTVTMSCPASFTYGQPATWTATATAGVAGDAVHYVWTLNGKGVGGDSDKLTTTLNAAGDKLTVTVTEILSDGTRTSSGPATTVCAGTYPTPTVTMSCPAAFTYGQPATWTATASKPITGATMSYLWALNGNVVQGATGPTLTTTLNSANDVLTVRAIEAFGDLTLSPSAPATATCTGITPGPPQLIPPVVVVKEAAGPATAVATGGTLPFTGSNALEMLAIAMGLLSGGLIVMWLSSRRAIDSTSRG